MLNVEEDGKRIIGINAVGIAMASPVRAYPIFLLNMSRLLVAGTPCT